MNRAVFEYLTNQKRNHTQLNEIPYKSLTIQPYLATKALNNKQKLLLYNLRSKCHTSKNNFNKIKRHNLNCSFNCPQIENLRHSFSNCRGTLVEMLICLFSMIKCESPDYSIIFQFFSIGV